mgnify:FL=1
MKQRLNDATDLEKVSDSDIRSYGNSTGLGLKKHDPGKYGSIVRAFQAGCSLREAAKIFGIAKNTAGAICIRELGQDGIRRATMKNLQRLGHQSSGDLIESMDELSPMQKATVMGISADKLYQMEDSRPEVNALQVNQVNVTANISDDAVGRLIETALSKKKGETTLDV